MRIVLMLSGTAWSGAAVHALLLTQELAARGHRILFAHRPGCAGTDQLSGPNIERLETSFSRHPRELKRVRKLVSDFGPDVIHTHVSSAHAYGAIARLLWSFPVVATAHSQSMQLHWIANTRVIATSPAAARFHHRFNRVPWKRIHMIPNCVDTCSLKPAGHEQRAFARTALGIPPDALVIGSVGHLVPRKRAQDLVRAFAQIAPLDANLRLLLIGGAYEPYTSETRRLACELGVADRMIITGTRSDVVQLLSALDVFALASSKESGPLAVLEALAMEIPVVSTDVGMLPDFVPNDRVGFHVPVGDVTALADRLRVLVLDPVLRERLGKAARLHVESNFSVQIVVPMIENVLSGAAGTLRKS